MIPSNFSIQDEQRMNTMFTIGHSNLDFAQFTSTLQHFNVQLLIDIRSRPMSSRFPQFNQPFLERQLESGNLRYTSLGEELGGRPNDPAVYRTNGLVDYSAWRRSYAFHAGIERVVKELENRAVALMCAEEDPLDCHRFLMVCPELTAIGIQPFHIRKDLRIEPQEAVESRLLSLNGMKAFAGDSLFPEERATALEKAYSLQAEKVAFRVDPLALDRW